MSAFNVMAGGRTQVLVDEQQLQALNAEVQRRGVELDRLKTAMETQSAVNTPTHFMAAAMALCNELASRWKAERVGIGFLKGRYVRLKALSHTEKITRNMQLVQDIEAAMEECLDQDVEVIMPPPKDAAFVYRAAETLSTRHGPNAVISLPLRRALPAHLKERSQERFGNVVAVLTVERKMDKPFMLPEIEALRLTSDLFTSRLVDLHENDRWFGAKALRGTRRALGWVVGAKHTWAKVAAIAVSGFVAFALLKDGMFRVEAPFEFQVTEKQVLSAPFDGRILTVTANVGDTVFKGETAAPFEDLNGASPLVRVLPMNHPASVLAVLDTSELVSKRISAQGEVEAQRTNAAIHRGGDPKHDIKPDEAEAQKDEAQIRKAQAEVDLYTDEIAKATIASPIDGVVLKGDLRTKIGAPLKAGDEMYEVGQLSKVRGELSVPEDQVSELKVGQHGLLRATSYPDRPMGFTVERIDPVATVSGSKNVFKVRVALDAQTGKNAAGATDISWVKPGVEGLAKVDIRQSRYAWIWCHRMINWVRMKLWL